MAAASWRRYPILAVAAVKIATEHAETEGARAGQGMEKRLLLDGIQVRAVDIAEGRIELALAVVAHLADAGEPGRDGATVAAGEAFHTIAVERAAQFSFACLARQLLSQGLHGLPTGIVARRHAPGGPAVTEW